MQREADPPFADLLARARDGDPGACALLFERIAGTGPDAELLLRMARQVLPPGDRMRDFVESRDLIQSALKSGWLDLAQFRGQTREEFLGWMRAILRRKLGRHARRRTPRPGGAPPGEGGADPPDLSESPLGAMIREETRQRVRAAMARLPDHERAVIEMRLRGLDSTQIAEITGLDPATVRKRASRAAEKLREVLGGEGLLDGG